MVDLHRQYLDIRDEVDRAIGDVIAETAFIKGPAVGLFEEELARRLEVRHCIACGNGTDALLLSLLAVGLQRGDEVIVPAFAFAAVAETVLLLGGVPVFADVDPRTFNIDPASVARLVSERTRVVIPVHLFGQPCDMAALTAVAKEHGLKVIEDNAQSLGAVCRMSDGREPLCGYDRGDRVHVVLSLQSAGLLRRRRARCSPTTTAGGPHPGAGQSRLVHQI